MILNSTTHELSLFNVNRNYKFDETARKLIIYKRSVCTTNSPFLIGEIMFLAWGIKVCYNVRNAESLFNEARLISYAIYNIAAVNINMIAIQYDLSFLKYAFVTLSI